ncbi:hypothetical protein ACQKKK_15950 [Peribacillus sp. NPDC006672]|uniref:hypothetical protein n=1 Tax=Peribacillus sp. NPDC006672 TaxID=3390606 RepID=UPI003D001938
MKTRITELLGIEYRLYADVIVGNETGGHPGMGDLGTLVMLPRVVDSVKIPCTSKRRLFSR